jgi:uncharacterized protein
VKIVADTNVVISGLLWGGPPGSVIDCAAIGLYGAITSQRLMTELEIALRHPKLAAPLSRRGWSADDVFRRYRAIARDALPADFPLPPSLRDPKDLPVLQCAVGGRVHAIVTGDRDLLALDEFEGVAIITPREFLLSIGL